MFQLCGRLCVLFSFLNIYVCVCDLLCCLLAGLIATKHSNFICT